jgi:uncharacterized tellurite resistance protein B-like protein
MFGFFEYQYLKFKKSHLRNLVALAAADGHIDESEIAYLYKIGEKYLLKPRQIKKILDKQEQIAGDYPDQDPQKVAMLYDLVGMMMADNIIKEAELEFCKKMFKKLGYKDTLIQAMIDQHKKGVNDAEDWEKFLEKSNAFKLNLAKW